MSDDRPQAQNCLDAETLAAFIDGRLEPRERAAVEAHLAECEDCYEVWMEGRATVADAGQVAPAAPGQTRPTWRFIAAAAAVLLLGVASYQVWMAGRPVGLLDELIAASPSRPSEGRLAGFRWAPVPENVRAAERGPTPPDVTIAVARLELALRAERSFETLRAYAIGQVVVGNFDSAIGAFNEALTLQNDPETLSDLSAAMLSRGVAQGQAVDFAEAYDIASRALALQDDLAEATFNRSVALERLGQHPQAIASWERYLELDSTSEWADEARRRLEVLRKPAVVSDRDQSRRTILENRVIAWASAMAQGTTPDRSLDEIAALARQADADTADHFSTDVVLSIQNSRSRETLAQAVIEYGDGLTASIQRDYRRAAQLLERAERSLAKLNSPLRFSATLAHAAACYNLQELPKTARLVTRVLSELPSRYPRLKGRALWLQGIVLMAQGRQALALDAYAESAALYTEAGEPANAAFVNGLMAEGYSLTGDHKRAWHFRLQSIANTTRGSSLLAAGLAARNQGWEHLATHFQDAAISASRTSGDQRGIVDSLRERALSYAAAQRIPDARRTIAEARQLASTHEGPDWVRLRAELDLAAARIADRSALPDALSAADRALEYFHGAGVAVRLPSAYLAKAGVLLALGDQAQARAALEAGLALYQEQRRRLPPGVLSASLGDTARDLVDRLVRLALDANEPDTAFAYIDENRSGHGGSEPVPTLRPQSLTRTLPAGVAVLSYYVSEHETLVWAVHRQRTAFHRARISQARLRELVARVAEHGAPDDSKELHDHLIAPVVHVLDPGGVAFVVPDGPLFRLPFAVLQDQSGRFLIETHAIALAPSASWLARPTRAPAVLVPMRSITAFGNPRLDRDWFPQLPNLAAAEAEAAAVVRPYTRKDVKTGSYATKAALAASLRSDDVVHFAGHALIDPADPTKSQLVLAPEGDARSMTADELLRFEGIRATLVVLAACQTAGGPMSRSEGPQGLARAFLQRGVRTVVASLADIGDNSSRTLFEHFHQHYASSGDAIRALQSAQQAALRSGDPTLRTWASVVVYGGWDSLETSQPTTKGSIE